MKIVKPLISIMILVAIVAVGVLVFKACSGVGCVQRIDKTEPDKIEVPYEVATQSHIYLASKATLNDDKTVTMITWYERVDGKWVQRDGSITLPAVMRPRINKR